MLGNSNALSLLGATVEPRLFFIGSSSTPQSEISEFPETVAPALDAPPLYRTKRDVSMSSSQDTSMRQRTRYHISAHARRRSDGTRGGGASPTSRVCKPPPLSFFLPPTIPNAVRICQVLQIPAKEIPNYRMHCASALKMIATAFVIGCSTCLSYVEMRCSANVVLRKPLSSRLLLATKLKPPNGSSL
jgi:hypothetical protein